MFQSQSFTIVGIPLVEFMYLAFTCKPGGVTVGDSGPGCCVPCLLNAFIPFLY